jgi:hypothetical protein
MPLTTDASTRQAGGKVAVLEKETFPRDKYCGAPEPLPSSLSKRSPSVFRACPSGDAVCTPAIRILTEMGVMQARTLSALCSSADLDFQNRS